MHYNTFELYDKLRDLCIIVTPFRQFKYNHLPVDINQSPDFMQEIMKDTIICYIK